MPNPSSFLAPLDASSVLPHRSGCLRPVAYPQHLVGGAQVLLDRRLRQVQPPGYLGVAQALHDHLQDLSLTGREVPYFGVLVLAQEVAEQLPGGGKLALLDDFHCPEHLCGVHLRMHEPIGAVFQRGPGQPKIQLRTEDQQRHARMEFPNASHALEAALLHAAPSVEHDARGAPGGGLPTDAHVGLALQDLLQALSRDRVRGGEHPDQPQELGRARCLWHRLQAPSSGRGARRRVDLRSLCPQLSPTFLCSHHVPSPSLRVGAEREGFWPSDPCDITEVGYEPCRVRRIPHMGYLCMPGGYILVRELRRTPLSRSSHSGHSPKFVGTEFYEVRYPKAMPR